MPDAEVSWYTVGSSFVQDGRRYAGVAVTTEEEVIWAEPMSPGTCAQQAELPALTKALELGQGQKVSVYNNSWYACATALVHGSMYKERGLLTTEEKKFKIKEQILALLCVYPRNWPPSIAPATREVMDPSLEKQPGRQTTQQVALQTNIVFAHALVDPGAPNLPEIPGYTEEDVA